MGLNESKDMMGFIDGSLPMPQQYIESLITEVAVGKDAAMNPIYLGWQKSNRLFCGWITSTLLEETLEVVVGLDTSIKV